MKPFETELCELFYKYRADKCPQLYHTYSEKYYELLKDRRQEVKNVLEIGVGVDGMKNLVGEEYRPGASLRAWRDFFPNATVFGADIERDVLFEEERIKCVYTDQGVEQELEKTVAYIRGLKKDPDLLFDLIIDDGSHILSHMFLTYKTLAKYLKPKGLYIIEDIKMEEMFLFENIDKQNNNTKMISLGEWGWDGFMALEAKGFHRPE